MQVKKRTKWASILIYSTAFKLALILFFDATEGSARLQIPLYQFQCITNNKMTFCYLYIL